MKKIVILCIVIIIPLFSYAQEKTKMDFEQYDPPSTLVVPEHKLTKAKFPFIDVHNHQWSMSPSDLEQLVKEMDKLNMVVMVNLSGRGRGSTQHLETCLENVKKYQAKRFIIFTNVDFDNIEGKDWQANTLRQLEEDVKKGANGLKIYKNLGMQVKDSKGNRVHIDDVRIDAV